MITKIQTLILAVFVLSSTLVQATIGEEEVSYDQLVKELNERVQSQTRSSKNLSSFDQLSIHGGFGYTSSLNMVSVGDSKRTIFEEGIQLSMGVDIFSRNWLAEGVLRNFGRSRREDYELTLREFDLRVVYRNMAQSNAGYRIINGLAARYMKYTDSSQGININQSTPSYILGMGIDIFLDKNLSLGVEFSGRTALIGESADKNSLDLSLKMDTYF